MSKNRTTLAALLLLANLWVISGAQAHDAPDAGAGIAAPPAILGDAPYQQRQTDGNAIGLVITNYGFFGNNFVTRSPSMEYPLGSQQEHLIRAGLWVAAINATGDTVVSTGCISGSWGGASSGASEFTPREKITERSILITSRAYSEKAISEQDFLTSYTDYPKRGTNQSVLRVGVGQASYLWSYIFAEAFVIVSFTVKNEGDGFLIDPCLGIFSELSSGWKGGFEVWRPSGSAWFFRKALEYFPQHRMMAEHHYNFANGLCPSWGAIAILGTKGENVPAIDRVKVSFNVWDWYWERDNPMNDPQRYELMSNREVDPTNDIQPLRDDPVEMISAGPFPTMAPGDSIVFVVAFLGGMDRGSLIQNVQWAQRAFDNDYILPSPPQPSRFRVKPDKGRITVFWDNYPEDKPDPFYKIVDFEGYRVYITRVEGATTGDFSMVREVDIVNGIGYDTGLESVSEVTTINDTTYTYRLDIDNVKDGFKYWVSLTSFDRGFPEEGVESLESGVLATRSLVIPGTPPAEDNQTVFVVPNPYRGGAVWDGTRDREKYVWFVNLPMRSTIRIYTLAGDLVKTIHFDGRTYDASDIQGLRTSIERSVSIAGGICAWDLISDEDQAVATGLYIYSVEDRQAGTNQLGKFMIIR
jgi:hypothetical protein